MTDDVPLTRRRVLAGLAGAGTLGSGAGALTSATLTDRELLPIDTTAGAAGISVDCDAADCSIEDGVLQFAFEAVPGETQRRTFTLSVDDNPVRVWAKTDCPPEPANRGNYGEPDDWPWHERREERPGNGRAPEHGPPETSPGRSSNGSSGNSTARPQGAPSEGPPDANGTDGRPPGRPSQTFGGGWSGPALASVLLVRASIAASCGTQGRRLYPEDGTWGTLRGFQTAFADGRRLDGDEPCFESGTGACLELEYRLPWWFAFVEPDTEADLELELYAEQCRHVDESAVGNPFESSDCGSAPNPASDPDPCPDCTRLGKLEVENERLEPTVYDFDEFYGQFAEDGHDYALDVLDVRNKDGGAETVCVECALLQDGEESLEMCTVKLKGSTEAWFEELDPPATRTPDSVCTAELASGNGERSDRPAISHLTVYVCDQDGDEQRSSAAQGSPQYESSENREGDGE